MTHATSMLVRGSLIALVAGIAPVSSAATQDVFLAAIQPVPAVAAPLEAPEAPLAAAPLVTEQVAGMMVEEARLAAAEADELNALEAEAEDLRPGQFVWRPERAERGPVEVVVSIERQMAYVYRANELIGVTTVSTGRRGHRTPTGSFTILQKARRHFSNLYNNAPMPNMQRLTWGGIALHAGALPGYPASHGCIRLPMEFSRLLFGATSLGGRVHIIADAPPSAAGALAFATGRQPSRTEMASR